MSYDGIFLPHHFVRRAFLSGARRLFRGRWDRLAGGSLGHTGFSSWRGKRERWNVDSSPWLPLGSTGFHLSMAVVALLAVVCWVVAAVLCSLCPCISLIYPGGQVTSDLWPWPWQLLSMISSQIQSFSLFARMQSPLLTYGLIPVTCLASVWYQQDSVFLYLPAGHDLSFCWQGSNPLLLPPLTQTCTKLMSLWLNPLHKSTLTLHSPRSKPWPPDDDLSMLPCWPLHSHGQPPSQPQVWLYPSCAVSFPRRITGPIFHTRIDFC